MSMMRKPTERASADPGQLWPYVRYVTFGDVLSAIAASSILFGLIGACAVGCYWVAVNLPAGQADHAGSALPSWVNYAAIAAIALWALRGQTLRIPRWSFGGWLAASLLAAVLCFVAANCAGWVSVSLFWCAWVLIAMLDTLNDRGMTIAEAGDESAASAP
jgi:hypothetical protein